MKPKSTRKVKPISSWWKNDTVGEPLNVLTPEAMEKLCKTLEKDYGSSCPAFEYYFNEEGRFCVKAINWKDFYKSEESKEL